MSGTKLQLLELALKDAEAFTGLAHGLVQGHIDAQGLQDARDELANASNSIDDAMGLIDALMQPEPTESERTGD